MYKQTYSIDLDALYEELTDKKDCAEKEISRLAGEIRADLERFEDGETGYDPERGFKMHADHLGRALHSLRDVLSDLREMESGTYDTDEHTDYFDQEIEAAIERRLGLE